MATDRARRVALIALLGVAAALATGSTAAVAATPSAAPAPGAPAAPTPDPSEPWWVPVGLRGHDVTAVGGDGHGGLALVVDGRAMASPDGGRTVLPAPSAPPPPTSVQAGQDRWVLDRGTVLHARGGGAAAPDAGAPDLGAGARLVAAPGGIAGALVAVSDAGVVWRRTPDGVWDRSLVLLPRLLAFGTPSFTAAAAFADLPVAAVYLATDGYSVLLSDDDGGSWRRAGPGLPDHVRGLTADSTRRALFAATDDGLWVHHLRALPAPPVYPGPDLLARWWGIAAVTVLGIAAGVLGLARALR